MLADRERALCVKSDRVLYSLPCAGNRLTCDCRLAWILRLENLTLSEKFRRELRHVSCEFSDPARGKSKVSNVRSAGARKAITPARGYTGSLLVGMHRRVHVCAARRLRLVCADSNAVLSQQILKHASPPQVTRLSLQDLGCPEHVTLDPDALPPIPAYSTSPSPSHPGPVAATLPGQETTSHPPEEQTKRPSGTDKKSPTANDKPGSSAPRFASAPFAIIVSAVLGFGRIF